MARKLMELKGDAPSYIITRYALTEAGRQAAEEGA